MYERPERQSQLHVAAYLYTFAPIDVAVRTPHIIIVRRSASVRNTASVSPALTDVNARSVSRAAVKLPELAATASCTYGLA